MEGLNSGIGVQESFGRFVSVANIHEEPITLSQRTEPFANPVVYTKLELS
jgi:hypothetical protein